VAMWWREHQVSATGGGTIASGAWEDNQDGDWDVALTVFMLLNAMQPVPWGMILWHVGLRPSARRAIRAASDPLQMSEEWLPTSTYLSGCVQYANRKMPAVPVTYYRLTIASDHVRGTPIGDPGLYGHECEVLLEPRMRFTRAVGQQQCPVQVDVNGAAIKCKFVWAPET
jgi:hypothetical protein